jgi:dissimilatory sulfite reductase (desulfoviridin) alpha/beta subunit
MSDVNFAELKKGGFMKQKQKDRFSMRLKTVGGQITAQQLQTIEDVAQKYGQGYIHLTSRQGIEIPFIAMADVEAVKRELAAGGVENGVCGPRLRTITACQGNAICPSGLIDTQHLAEECDRRYGGREFPCKFKIGITGCPNNCLKAEENDLGIKGGVLPQWTKDDCIFCGVCQPVCPRQAIIVDKQSRSLDFHVDQCIYCGKCIKSCPVSAWSGDAGYVVSLGGLYGKQIAIGKHVLPIISNEETLHRVIEITLDFFERQAKAGERFAKTLDRVGWDKLQKALEEVL